LGWFQLSPTQGRWPGRTERSNLQYLSHGLEGRKGRGCCWGHNLRHKAAIDHSPQSLNRAVKALTENQPVEIVALELRDSLDRIGEIVGAVTTEDILNKIFSDFCIGK